MVMVQGAKAGVTTPEGAGLALDTEATRRLRDRLLGPVLEAPLTPPAPGSGAEPNPDQQAALERIGPIAEVLFLVMEADDDRPRAECESVRRAIGVLTDDLLPAPIVDALLGRLEVALSRDGRDGRLEALATRFALDRSDAEVAFRLAAAIALADGEVAPEETAVVDAMRRYFGISAERAAALLAGAPAAR